MPPHRAQQMSCVASGSHHADEAVPVARARRCAAAILFRFFSRALKPMWFCLRSGGVVCAQERAPSCDWSSLFFALLRYLHGLPGRLRARVPKRPAGRHQRSALAPSRLPASRRVPMGRARLMGTPPTARAGLARWPHLRCAATGLPGSRRAFEGDQERRRVVTHGERVERVTERGSRRRSPPCSSARPGRTRPRPGRRGPGCHGAAEGRSWRASSDGWW
jgi:hypothetical protein